MRYFNCEIKKTKTTIDGTKFVFGKSYHTIKNVYEISGAIEKRAGEKPFLTSIADCKAYIRSVK